MLKTKTCGALAIVSDLRDGPSKLSSSAIQSPQTGVNVALGLYHLRWFCVTDVGAWFCVDQRARFALRLQMRTKPIYEQSCLYS